MTSSVHLDMRSAIKKRKVETSGDKVVADTGLHCGNYEQALSIVRQSGCIALPRHTTYPTASKTT